jgi:hypothetical protein
MSEGAVTKEVLGVKKAMDCMILILTKFSRDLAAFMDDKEDLPDADVKKEALVFIKEEKEKITSFIKKEHSLSDEDCSLLLNNINPGGKLIEAMLKFDGKKNFLETVEYFKELGYKSQFLTYEELARIIEEL